MKQTFDISGMTCAACSARVQKATSAVDGVAEANVNLLKNSMDVTFDDGADVQAVVAAICSAVDKAGYGAAPRADNQSQSAGAIQETPGASVFTAQTNAQPRASQLRQAEAEQMRMRLIVSLVFGIPLFYIAMAHMVGLPIPFDLDNLSHLVPFALTQFLLLIPIVFVNMSYFTRGFKSLFHLSPNMDSLIALGAAASIVWSIYQLFVLGSALGSGQEHVAHDASMNLYFDSAGMILALITLGKYFEARAKGKTTAGIEALMDLSPATALVQRQGLEVEIPTRDLRVGDVMIIKAGAAIPTDGVVLEGSGSVDESALTGESVPVDKVVGDAVTGATINQTGWMLVEATRVGNDTALAQIIQLVDDATSTKAPIERKADQIAAVFVPIVIGIALVTFIAWLVLGGGMEKALSHAITVLVISCPCALGLATPTAVMVGTGRGASQGILVKSAETLEAAHDTSIVVLDKTGTVTQGTPQVTDVLPASGITESELLAVAAAIEEKSEHPLAQAIVGYVTSLPALDAQTPNIDTFDQVAGQGLVGTCSGASILAGNKTLMQAHNIDIQGLQTELDRLSDEGKTPLLFARNTTLLGTIAVADVARPESAAALAELKSLGIETVLLTGDNQRTAHAIGNQVGAGRVVAEVLPQDKEAEVRALGEGATVAMVGDGINDAPALARADVGIAIGSGTDVAIESADAVLTRSNLLGVPAMIQLSRATMRNIKQNLFWALFYNVLCIPLAAGVLSWAGVNLNPMIAAAAMSFSSIFVVSNALRLRGWKPVFATAEAQGFYEQAREAASLPEDSSNLPQDETTITATHVGSEGDSVSTQDATDAYDNQHTSGKDIVMEKVLDVEGMMCEKCVAHVKKALEGIEDVAEVDVDLEGNCATVQLTSDVDNQVLIDAVVEAGYEASVR